MTSNIESVPDQEHIQCPVCGKIISYHRWDSRPQKFVCSPECQDRLDKVTGDRTSEKYMLQRAADPDICVMCAGPLEGRDRCFKIYCGPRCEKRGWKKGVDSDRLMRIRKEAVQGRLDHIAPVKGTR